MRLVNFLGLAVLLIAVCPVGGNVTERPLLTNGTKMPDDLYETYDSLVKAMKAGDEKGIRKHILPDSVEITHHVRPKGGQNWGYSINLPFAKSDFKGDVIVTTVYSDTFSIGTSTSHFVFVATKQSGWKLFEYRDRPFEG